MYAHCEMGGGCCCLNASRVWPCRWFQLLPVTWWMREEKENYHLILDSLLAGIVIYSFSSYTSPIFPFSFFKIFVFERFREMSRKMFGGFDLPLSPTPEISSRNSSIRITPTSDFILFFLLFSFSFVFFFWHMVACRPISITRTAVFFLEGRWEWMNERIYEWMNQARAFISKNTNAHFIAPFGFSLGIF